MTSLALLPDNAGANANAGRPQRHRFTSNIVPAETAEGVRVCGNNLLPTCLGRVSHVLTAPTPLGSSTALRCVAAVARKATALGA